MYIDVELLQNVGIGTNTPNASAKLDIEDANRGVLIPRVSLVDVSNSTTPINTPTTSLLVYNTNAGITGGNGEQFNIVDGFEVTGRLNRNGHPISVDITAG